LLDAVTASDHLNMDIICVRREGNFTLWMCLGNQHNNSILCVKHIFLSLDYGSWDHVLFGVRLKFTRGASKGTLLVLCK